MASFSPLCYQEEIWRNLWHKEAHNKKINTKKYCVYQRNMHRITTIQSCGQEEAISGPKLWTETLVFEQKSSSHSDSSEFQGQLISPRVLVSLGNTYIGF